MPAGDDRLLLAAGEDAQGTLCREQHQLQNEEAIDAVLRLHTANVPD